MLYKKEFEKLFKKILFDYKNFLDKSFRTTTSEIKSGIQPVTLISGMILYSTCFLLFIFVRCLILLFWWAKQFNISYHMSSPPDDLSWVKFEKQFEDFRRKIKEMNDGCVIIQNIVHEIKVEMQLVTMKFSIIIEQKSTSGVVLCSTCFFSFYLLFDFSILLFWRAKPS